MRVFIAERLPQVRLALKAVLTQHPEVQVVGEAAHAQDLVAEVPQAQPDLLLLSWEMAQQLNFDALHQSCPHLFVVALSGRPELRQEALEAGADAFVSKTDSPESLLTAIIGWRDPE